MDRLFRQSGLMREKWDEIHSGDGRTYGEMTISKAIKFCDNVWTPKYKAEASGGVGNALEFLKKQDVFHNTRYSLDDVGAGYLLADYLKPFARPLRDMKKWINYNGVAWSEKTGTETAEEAAKDMSRALEKYADELTGSERQTFSAWAAKWKTYSKRVQFLKDAESVYPVSRDEFDSDAMLFNVSNGTLDLNTMSFRDHNPEDLITHVASVDYIPGLRCERWVRFVEEIMEPGNSEIVNLKNGETDDTDYCDKNVEAEKIKVIQTEKILFLKRFCGYCLTGKTREEAFMIIYGPTSRNGKSVFVNTIQNLLGSYAKTANADSLMLTTVKDGSGPSEDIARLAGTRMVSVGELPQNGTLNSAKIKLITGGDKMTARYLKENSFEFSPRFKLLLHTNHLPACNDMSVFESGRAIVLPFSRHFDEREQDRNLKEQFVSPEAQSGILNWLLEGLQEYLKDGLGIPESVRRATKTYRRENDTIGRFIDDRLKANPKGEIRVSEVYEAYQLWCYSDGRKADAYKVFADSLKRAGIEIERRRPRNGKGEKTTYISGFILSDSVIAA